MIATKIAVHSEQQQEESIRYAHRLQSKMLPSLRVLRENFEESFVLFRPSNLISSGFYWFSEHYGKMMIATACCNTPGFAGALTTAVATGFLNRVAQEKAIINPGDVLQDLHKLLAVDYDPDEKPVCLKIAFAVIDLSENTLSFAGAGLPLIRFRRGRLIEYPACDLVLGNASIDNLTFNQQLNHEQLEAGDMLYLFTDGIIDVLATETDRSNATRRFHDLLAEIQTNPTDEQAPLLERILVNRWPQSQVEHDLLLLGLRVAEVE